jgi:hypothetical protein
MGTILLFAHLRRTANASGRRVMDIASRGNLVDMAVSSDKQGLDNTVTALLLLPDLDRAIPCQGCHSPIDLKIYHAVLLMARKR